MAAAGAVAAAAVWTGMWGMRRSHRLSRNNALDPKALWVKVRGVQALRKLVWQHGWSLGPAMTDRLLRETY